MPTLLDNLKNSGWLACRKIVRCAVSLPENPRRWRKRRRRRRREKRILEGGTHCFLRSARTQPINIFLTIDTVSYIPIRLRLYFLVLVKSLFSTARKFLQPAHWCSLFFSGKSECVLDSICVNRRSLYPTWTLILVQIVRTRLNLVEYAYTSIRLPEYRPQSDGNNVS